MRRVVSRILPTASLFLNHSLDRGPASSSSARLSSAAIDDFYMELDSPHASWAPGDEISGRIIVASKRNVSNIVITLSLIGHVKINSSASYAKLRPLQKTLFNHTVQIYGPTHDALDDHDLVNGLNVGEHRFPFVVKLPTKRVFTSLDFGKGSITYVLRACMGGVSSYVSSPTTLSHSIGSSPMDASPGSDISTVGQGAHAVKAPTLRNPPFTAERLITLVCPIDVSKLAPATAKRLILRNNRSNGLLRTQSGNSSLCVNAGDQDSRLVASILGDASSEPGPLIARTLSNLASAAASTSAQPSPSILTSAAALHANSPSAYLASPVMANRQATVSPPPNNHILVSLEIPQRGYLRGELLPIQLTINHIKMIHDLNGVIITLVRVCRIGSESDLGPDIFRKDLQQLILPMYIDPLTFELQVRASLRVPADAFPTISGCPLVSFSYFVEVLINLLGKLIAIESRATGPNLDFGIPSMPPLNTALTELKARHEFINTDRLKRLRKFLQLSTEVVIGTHRLGLPVVTNSQALVAASPNNEAYLAAPAAVYPAEADSPGYIERPSYSQTESPRNDPVPLMEMPELQHLSEKERVRAYETSLMPSAPPDLEALDRGSGAGASASNASIDPHGFGAAGNFHSDSNLNFDAAAEALLRIGTQSLASLPVLDRNDFHFFLRSDPSEADLVPQYFASSVANSETIHT